MTSDIWTEVIERLRARVDGEDLRRWFGGTAYASDSGDLITVWVPTEVVRRHLSNIYAEDIARALATLGRADTRIRFVVGGLGEDEDEED